MAEGKEIAKGVVVVVLVVGSGYGIYRLTRRSGGARPPPPVDLAFAIKVVEALVPKLGITPAEPGELGVRERLRLFFLYRRAVTLGLADASLRSGSGLETLKQRVEQDLSRVAQFASDMVGTASVRGPYYGAPGSSTEPLLDLGRYVAPRIGDIPPTTEADAIAATSPTKSQAQTLLELDLRRMRALNIIWRAAAIDGDLWNAAGLKVDDLTEILDRRLRTVERLRYEASAGVSPDGIGTSHIERGFSSSNNPSTILGPWNDDWTVRMFEAPSVARTFESLSGNWVLKDFFDTSGNVIIDPSHPRYLPSSVNWYRNFATDEYDWNIWPGTRMGKEEAPLWKLTPNEVNTGFHGYGWIVKPVSGIQAAEILRRLFVPSLDWWERAWLHGDGLMSALHLEALRHAKRRRTQSDALFDALPARFNLALDDYFEVRAHAVRPADGIMRAGRTDHFENGTAALDDLQIGDQVLYQTNAVLLALGSSGWDYPTAMVTAVDTSPEAPQIRVDEMRVQGFGTADLDHGSMRLLLSKNLEATLKAVQEFIPRQLATPILDPERLPWDSGLIVTPDDRDANDSRLLRLWNPYGDAFDPPGPWWIWINLNAPMYRDAFNGDVNTILAQAPNGFVWVADDNLLPEFRGRVDPGATIPFLPVANEPPWEDNPVGASTANPRRVIFVPLFEPGGGWISYFFDKANNPNLNVGSRLEPTRIDAAWLPDLAQREGAIRIIRPRIEPTP